MVTDKPPRQNPEEGESTTMLLLTRSETADMPDSKVPSNVRDIALHIFDTCLPKWEKVDPQTFK